MEDQEKSLEGDALSPAVVAREIALRVGQGLVAEGPARPEPNGAGGTNGAGAVSEVADGSAWDAVLEACSAEVASLLAELTLHEHDSREVARLLAQLVGPGRRSAGGRTDRALR